ncbi:hypothetical protein [Photobacterium damselae]|uniref:hypothetical protein n=1 Tax=Photobacterium damselae TaxID=38293 RepID=UPI001EFD0BC9|nr:hypothetical protein [Photobacterium damselae]MCG9780663.1 hypothetical protein [Photobacterium damselae]
MKTRINMLDSFEFYLTFPSLIDSTIRERKKIVVDLSVFRPELSYVNEDGAIAQGPAGFLNTFLYSQLIFQERFGIDYYIEYQINRYHDNCIDVVDAYFKFIKKEGPISSWLNIY